MLLNNFPFIICILFSVVRVYGQNQTFSSKLPLVFIDTNGRQIPDEPKILVDMGIIWNGDGEENHTSDEFNHYYGKIGIELRGSTSQSFPKKSYGFETRNQLGEDIDFPILGLPEEEDWILYAPYSDKSLIRNVLTFSLAKPLGHYASRCRFVELFLNNEYQGIYVLMEKIKREDTRVDIEKLTPDKTGGVDLTGGYIVKIDKTTGSGGEGWHSNYQNSDGNFTYYQYEVPAFDEIIPEQKQYIQNYIDSFEEALFEEHFEGRDSYIHYINMASFIDYILMNELTKNVDAYRLSTFFYKDRNEKLRAGPIWDYNLAYGNVNYDDAWLTEGFQLENQKGYNPFWWEKLWADSVFVNYQKCRWEMMREDHWSDEYIFEMVDSLVASLENAVERNFERWPVLGKPVWPNYFITESYGEEINWLKNWLEERLWWLDNNMPGNCIYEWPPHIEDIDVLVYPNPVTTTVNLNVVSGSGTELHFRLFNVSGSLVMERKFSIAEGEQLISIRAGELPKGIYLYVLSEDYSPFQKGKLVKY
ncbi:MAG: CotH kinase family protein [Bacteroidota bacterium]